MHLARLQSPKQRSLAAFVLFCLSIALAGAVAQMSTIEASLAPGLLAVGGILTAYWLVARTKCPHCATPLARNFPFSGGGAILLWAVTEHCPKCKEPLT